jgi:hypothetical protein
MPTTEQEHRVYVSFQCRDGWHCQFLEPELQTPLPRRLHFKSADKVRELIQRGNGLVDSDAQAMVNQGIEMGRGGIFLESHRGTVPKTKAIVGSNFRARILSLSVPQ